MPNNHCVYAFNEDSYYYRNAIKGLRGKRREAFKLGVARAATKAEAVYAEAAKDKRIPKIVALSKSFHAQQQKLRKAFEAKVAKITDEYRANAKAIQGDITLHAANYAVDSAFLTAVIADIGIRDLVNQIAELGEALHSEQRAAIKADVQLSDCGVRLPRPSAAKKVLADPKLKALIDSIGAE